MGVCVHRGTNKVGKNEMCVCDIPLYADNAKPATIHSCVNVCVCMLCVSAVEFFLPSFVLCSFPFSFVFYSGIATASTIIEIKQTHDNQIQFKH